MRVLKLMLAAGLLASTAACAVYTTDRPYHNGYYAYHYEQPYYPNRYYNG